MPVDNYAYENNVMSASRNIFNFDPEAGEELPVLPKAVYVGEGGTVVLRGFENDSDATLPNVASGTTLFVRPSHIRNAAGGTTASGFVIFA